MLIIHKNEINKIPFLDKSKKMIMNQFINYLDEMAFVKGKIEDINSELFCYSQEYETHPYDCNGWEMHRVYYDIQYIQKGEELAYYKPDNLLAILQPYNENSDCETAVALKGDSVAITAGNIIVFAPGEYHNTGTVLKEKCIVRKFVIKVSTK